LFRDFEAATDWLLRDATAAALVGCEHHPLYSLAWTSLAEGVASYPKWTGIAPVVASEGQLMGHPLSFPLLCVINLACYRFAVKEWQRQELTAMCETGLRNLDELLQTIPVPCPDLGERVLVNGDDILFPVPAGLYPVWRRVTAAAGLRISLGKNFVSQYMCQINSQVFVLDHNGTRRVGYLNQRFLTGTNVKTGMSECTPDQIGKELSKMVRLCPWAACGIPKAFRRWGQDWLGRFSPNWYLPVHLGGFGLDLALGPEHIRVTREQRRMAARFVADPSLSLYRRIGSVKAVKLMMRTVVPRMVRGSYVPAEGEELSTRWEGPLQTLARVSAGPDRLMSDAVVMAREFRSEYRLKPMSLESILDYWHVQFFVPRLPDVPGYAALPDFEFETVASRGPTGFESVIAQNGGGDRRPPPEIRAIQNAERLHGASGKVAMPVRLGCIVQTERSPFARLFVESLHPVITSSAIPALWREGTGAEGVEAGPAGQAGPQGGH